MNSLSLGFLYICGLSWLLLEVCLSASFGNWTPFIIFWVGFAVMFAVLGCLPLSNRAIDLAGAIFAILIGAGIALYGFGALHVSVALQGSEAFLGSLASGIVRVLGGAVMIALGAIALGTRRKDAH